MNNDAFSDGQACAAKYQLRRRLMHRQSRREDPRMGIGNAEHLQNPLDRAIFPTDPMQGVEDHVRTRIKCAQQCWDIVRDIDHPYPIAAIRKRFGALVPARQ